LAIASAVGLAISGVFSVGGYCWGICDQERKKEFDRLFGSWIADEVVCWTAPEQVRLLDSLDPYLAKQMRARSALFAKVEARHRNGTLTVGEREAYLSDPWRVPEPQDSALLPPIFGDMTADRSVGLVRRCRPIGFVVVNRAPSAICTGNLRIDFSQQGFSQWSHFKERAYRTLVETRDICQIMLSMRENVWRDIEAKEQAEAAVDALPAAIVPSEAVSSSVERAYAELRCARHS
jgi:hypothetical protein